MGKNIAIRNATVCQHLPQCTRLDLEIFSTRYSCLSINMYLFEVSASAYSTYNIVFVSYVFKRPNTTIGQVFLHSSVVDVLVKAQILT